MKDEIETAGRTQIKEGYVYMVKHSDLILKAAERFTIRTGTNFFLPVSMSCDLKVEG